MRTVRVPGQGGILIMHRYIRTFMALGLVGVLAIGCASDKGPAETAIKAAETAITAAAGEAARYVPDQAKALEAALAAAKEKFSKGDYTAALADAQALPGKAKDVAAAVAAKKAELTKAWEGMSAGMPQVVDAIKSRVDILSQAKKLPATMTADKLAAAKAGLAELTQSWTTATEAFKGGNIPGAVATATAMKAKATEVLGILGMPVPDALKG
jgi:hypothetical protein